jgi:hypothetical protein
LALIAEGRRLIPNTSDADARIRQARLSIFEARALAAKRNLVAARTCYETALEAIRALGSATMADAFVASLGDLAMAEGDDTRALELFEQCLPGLRSGDGSSSDWDLTLLLVDMGFLKLRSGDVISASDMLEEASRHWLELGVRAGVGVTMRGLAGVAVAQGDSVRAGLLFGASTRWLVDRDPFLNEVPGLAAAVERCLAEARQRTDPDEFASAWKAGASLSEPEALDMARVRRDGLHESNHPGDRTSG